jgi:hypothetical protein
MASRLVVVAWWDGQWRRRIARPEAVGVAAMSRSILMAWPHVRGEIGVRRERARGGIYRGLDLAKGLGFGGVGLIRRRRRSRARAGLCERDDRQAPPVSLWSSAGVPIRPRRLSGLGRLLSLDRIGRRGPFLLLFWILLFSFIYLIQKLILKTPKMLNFE